MSATPSAPVRLEGGFFPAVPVPLRSDGTMDAGAQERYVAYMRGQKPTGVAVWAHTGRGLHLSRPQREAVLKTWREGLEPGSLVVAGVGGRTDAEAVAMAEDAAAWGADVLMAYAPVAYRGLPDQDERVLERHRRLAAVGKPLVLFYLYEAAGGISYSLPLLRELFGLPGVAGIKMATLDSVMTYQDVAALIAQVAPEKTLITGEDRFLGYSLMAGARAALVGMGAAFTRFQHDLVRTWLAGDWQQFIPLSQQADLLARATFTAPMEGYIRRMLWCLVALGVIPEEAACDPWGPALPAQDRETVMRVIRDLREV